MSITLVSKSYGFDITTNEAGVPTGVANVKEGIGAAVVSGVTGILNGGKSHAVGAAATGLEVAKIIGYPNLSAYTRGEEMRLIPYGQPN